ncbi:MAG: hypothetical protein P8H63_03005 [Flavobacteriaceae bacterium]|nr:hypothetical protein [Flavobacteriaceae bacterium]
MRFSNKIKKKFYSDVAFQISVAFDGDWTHSVEPASEFFRDYTHYDLDFYGMARRGSTWKGNRMIKNDD